ncbi:MAG: efflux RND transporter periplasmic adaptor subunit [Isosphaeraceae bacterium]|nr:efflux RND transporter periplasmic adaptor subunit [Isosphaeraceae bacterium]
MTTRHRISFLCLAAFMGAGCSGSISEQARSPGVASSTSVVKVEVVAPERRTVRRVERVVGRLEPAEVAPLQAKLSGYLETLTIDIGARVTKGQLIARISAPEVDAKLDEKRSAVAQAQARLVQTRAGVALASASVASALARVGEAGAGLKRSEAELARWVSEYARTKQLGDERAVTQSLVDESRSKLQAAEAAIEADRAKIRSAEADANEARAALAKAEADVVAAESGVRLSEAEVRHAEAMVSYTRLIAPFDGMIVERNTDSGRLTEEGPRGESLFVLARTDLLTAVLTVPERFALAVRDGADVELIFPALGERVVPSKVSRRSRMIDAESGTTRIEVDIDNGGGTLEPGLYVRAGIVLEEHRDVLTVPSTAVIKGGPEPSVAVVVDGKVSRTRVALGLEDSGRVEVREGLTGTESIIKEGGAALAIGQAVETMAPTAAAKKS